MRYLAFLLLAFFFAASAQGQAFIPSATTSGGIHPWVDVQVGVTMTGSQSKLSPVGGASALYVGRNVQAAYVGPTFRLSHGSVKFNLITSVGVNRISSTSSQHLPDATPSHVYPLSTMIGLTIQDGARAFLMGVEYSPGYEPASEERRPRFRHYDHAQQRRLVIGLGWSL